MTVRDLANTVDISKRSVNTTFKDILCLKRIKSRLVPKQFNCFEKECYIKICEKMVSDYQPVIKRIITGNETRIYACNLETIDESSERRARDEAKPCSTKILF